LRNFAYKEIIFYSEKKIEMSITLAIGGAKIYYRLVVKTKFSRLSVDKREL